VDKFNGKQRPTVMSRLEEGLWFIVTDGDAVAEEADIIRYKGAITL